MRTNKTQYWQKERNCKDQSRNKSDRDKKYERLETKSLFFEKINKINKLLIKKKRERTQNNKIRNEREATTEKQRIIKITMNNYMQVNWQPRRNG